MAKNLNNELKIKSILFKHLGEGKRYKGEESQRRQGKRRRKSKRNLCLSQLQYLHMSSWTLCPFSVYVRVFTFSQVLGGNIPFFLGLWVCFSLNLKLKQLFLQTPPLYLSSGSAGPCPQNSCQPSVPFLQSLFFSQTIRVTLFLNNNTTQFLIFLLIQFSHCVSLCMTHYFGKASTRLKTQKP